MTGILRGIDRWLAGELTMDLHDCGLHFGEARVARLMAKYCRRARFGGMYLDYAETLDEMALYWGERRQ